jgi:type IV pilus assembly protein PilC
MVAAGEAGGILDTILKRLATYIEKAVKLAGQVKSAMIYPIAVIVIAACVVTVILWKVIPTFATLFAGLGAELPLPTRIVIAMSNGLVRFFPFIFAGIGGMLFGIRSYYQTDGGRHKIDALLLEAAYSRRNPPQDRRRAFLSDARDAHQLGRPHSRGTRDHSQNGRQHHHRGSRDGDRTSIEHGESISAPLKETAVFPPMVVQMIGVGEATGALETMLAKVADFYEDEVDTAVAGLLTLLEPVMIAVLGVIVGGIVISMYLPIFDLISKLA